MSKRENLMLAHVFDSKKHGIAGWMLSDKLDGMRCFWDGGISRGVLCSDVPYANTDKDARLLTAPVATGLWTRYMKVIHAPSWWLDNLPPVPLDGELYCGVGRFQDVMSYCKKHNPIDSEWKQVSYRVFDKPALSIVLPEHQGWWKPRKQHDDVVMDVEQSYNWLTKHHPTLVHPQIRLPYSTADAVGIMEDELERVTDGGGEGLMLRKPSSVWQPHRSWELLKVKKLSDGEGTVIGYTSGRKTDKGSKLLGLVGALIIRYGNKTFELSGLTEEERTFSVGTEWAAENPGVVCPEFCVAKHFPIGCVVRFRFRELTRDGIPKEARFWR